MKRQTPERTCMGTGETAPKGDLLRFVKGPDGMVWFDVLSKAPGRGAYTLPTVDAVQKAIKKRAFSRKLEGQVPEDLVEQVAQQLSKAALQSLALAKKGGQLAIGLDEVIKAKQAQTLKALLLVEDAGKNVLDKTKGWDVPKCQNWHKEDLEKVLGVPNVVVVGLTNGAIWPNLQRTTEFMKLTKTNDGK